MLSASALKKCGDFKPIPVPEEYYFANLVEAETKLAYAIYYDNEYNQEILKAISDSDHRIGFIALGTDRNRMQKSVEGEDEEGKSHGDDGLGRRVPGHK